jgi:hypothetical protein
MKTNLRKKVKKLASLSKSDNVVYHYTNASNYPQIMREGFLRGSLMVERRRRGFCKPVLWFSKNKFWEPIAMKMVIENNTIRDLTPKRHFETVGMVRFGIKFTPQLKSWEDYKKASNIPGRVFLLLELSGLIQGAKPKDWYYCLGSIPLSDCISIEQYDGNTWISMLSPRRDAS